MKIGLKLFFWFVIFLVGFGFYIKNVSLLDPDFGWHLHLGQLILKSGIPKLDPFSYTMPSFPFIDHEWLSNVIIYLVYSKSQFVLNIIFAIFTTATFIIQFPKKNKWLAIPFFLLSCASIVIFSGVRVQVVSWFLFSVLLKIIFDESLWKKWRITVPLLVVIWANLHGGFAIAIFLLGIFLFSRIFLKKIDKWDFAVFLASIAATFVNPYGARLWSEVLSSVTDTSLRFEIQEWLPGVLIFNVPLVVLVSIILGLGSSLYKKLTFTQIGIFIVFLLLAASSIRHTPFFIIIAFCFSTQLFTLFYSGIKKAEQKKRFDKFNIGLFLIAGFLFIYAFYNSAIHNPHSVEKFYPTKDAVGYMSKNAKESQIFALYNWGGYLIWKLPSKKVFIDGRMPSWRFKAPVGQADSALKEYDSIVTGDADYKVFFDKYKIAWAILDKPCPQNRLFLCQRLLHDGWSRVYEDKVSIIYKKPILNGSLRRL